MIFVIIYYILFYDFSHGQFYKIVVVIKPNELFILLLGPWEDIAGKEPAQQREVV